MPPISGFAEVALYVDDPERSREFYASVFGFSTIGEDARLIALGVTGGQVLLLCRREASADRGHTAHDGKGRSHLAFRTSPEGMPEWEAWLTERGVAIVERRAWAEGGRSTYFRDPDGHLLELATPGVWNDS